MQVNTSEFTTVINQLQSQYIVTNDNGVSYAAFDRTKENLNKYFNSEFFTIEIYRKKFENLYHQNWIKEIAGRVNKKSTNSVE